MLKLEKYKRILNRCIFNSAIKSVRNNRNTNLVNNQLIKNFGIHTLGTNLSQKQIKHVNSEFNAVINLIKRSYNLNNITTKHFHTSYSLYTTSNKDDKSPKKTSSKDDLDSEPPLPSKNNNDKPNNKNDDKKKKEDEERIVSVLTKALFYMFSIYMIVILVTMLFPNKNRPETSTRFVSWHEFVHHMLAIGEVKELVVRPDLEMVTIILHEGAVIKGRKSDSNIYHMAIADATMFEEKLRDVEKRLGITSGGIQVSYDRNSDIMGKLIVTLIVATIVLSIFSRMRGMQAPISMDSFTQMGRAKFTLVDPYEGGKGVLFKDVAGLQEAKQEVKEFVDYLKKPEIYQILGAKVPKGALLLGPPGCGKTMLAKAVATEAQVPFLSMNGSEFIEMIGGLGAARVRDLFKEAKKRSPCIIYIDEIDAIGRQRAGVGGQQQFSSGESEQTLNQLLVEMDGMASKEGVLMLASTNRADILDKALLRPGRFDRHILIDLPNASERKDIFERHLSGISLEEDPNTYSNRLSRLTPGFSGADIANVCNEAALHAARSNQKSVTSKNLEYAVERLVGGTEKRSHALSKTERRVIAFHESGHALIGWLLPYTDVLLKVTIVPRTNLALGFAQYTPSEQKLFTKEQLFDKMCMALGGRAAENITFQQITSGAQNDLEKVTKIAYAQIKKFGMNDKLGPIYIPDANETEGDKPYSKSLDNIIDREVRELVFNAYQRTEQVLIDNRDKLIKLSEALLEKETLNYDEVVELIGPPTHVKDKQHIEPVDFEHTLKELSRDKEPEL